VQQNMANLLNVPSVFIIIYFKYIPLLSSELEQGKVDVFFILVFLGG